MNPEFESSADELAIAAGEATALLKSMANQSRLQVLCLLVNGEKSVTELEQHLNIPQPRLSQHLARLREDGMVAARRSVKLVYYSLASEEARLLVGLLHQIYCPVIESESRAVNRKPNSLNEMRMEKQGIIQSN